MLSDDYSLTNCHFCSTVSLMVGEDPIGSAVPCDHWLIVELPQPWAKMLWQEHPILKPLLVLIKELFVKHGIKIQPIVIAPDREYSRPGYTRIFYYHRPQRLFNQFDKQEFIVPDEFALRLAKSILLQLLNQPNELHSFIRYKQLSSHIREILTCTHGNVDIACARFGYPVYQKLRFDYAANSEGKLRVWRCSHFGGHQFAPTLVDLPQGHYWGHLQPEVLDNLIYRNSSFAQLYKHYRGWAGLSKFEQIAEREIFMSLGWEWLKYDKAGQLIVIDKDHECWAEVRINCTNADAHVSQAYEAKVELSGYLITALNSGKNQPRQKVKQYRVSRLV